MSDTKRRQDPEWKALRQCVDALEDAPGYTVEPIVTLVQALTPEGLARLRRVLTTTSKLSDEQRQRVAAYLRDRFSVDSGAP